MSAFDGFFAWFPSGSTTWVTGVPSQFHLTSRGGKRALHDSCFVCTLHGFWKAPSACAQCLPTSGDTRRRIRRVFAGVKLLERHRKVRAEVLPRLSGFQVNRILQIKCLFGGDIDGYGSKPFSLVPLFVLQRSYTEVPPFYFDAFRCFPAHSFGEPLVILILNVLSFNYQQQMKFAKIGGLVVCCGDVYVRGW